MGASTCAVAVCMRKPLCEIAMTCVPRCAQLHQEASDANCRKARKSSSSSSAPNVHQPKAKAGGKASNARALLDVSAADANDLDDEEDDDSHKSGETDNGNDDDDDVIPPDSSPNPPDNDDDNGSLAVQPTNCITPGL